MFGSLKYLRKKWFDFLKRPGDKTVDPFPKKKWFHVSYEKVADWEHYVSPFWEWKFRKMVNMNKTNQDIDLEEKKKADGKSRGDQK